MTRNSRLHALLLGSALSVLAATSPALAQSIALPAGGAFVRGQGQISPASGGVLTISQSSLRGVINWRDFSIGAGGQVVINNANGATLNQVTGGQLSQISGLLSATGSVYLINPNGVIVGPGGRILAGGNIVASTRGVSPDAFMTGGPLQLAGASTGAVINNGQIVSQSGGVVLVGRSVVDSGTIQAGGGPVELAAADDVLLGTTDGQADNLYVAVDGGSASAPTDRIQAAAGALKAAGGNLFTLAGNRRGLTQATRTERINGELWLSGSEGTVQVSGTITAHKADGSGGNIVINGQNVQVAGSAHISAAGSSGGQVLIGASQFGTATDLASTVTIASGATILAGGPQGGGQIETSAHQLSIQSANISAGYGGQWLLDPDDLTIDTAAAATITASLNGGTNVSQSTTAGGTGGSGDITVAAPIVWTGSGGLTLDAYRDLAVNAQISGGGSLTLTATRNLTIGAPTSATAVNMTAGGLLTLNAGGTVSGGSGVTLTDATFVNNAGANALSSTGGRWLVYSTDPAADTTGGLNPAFYQYAAAAGTTPAAAGDGLLYSTSPSVSFTLGTVTKSYDGTTTAPLDGSDTTFTGLINGDVGALVGSYGSKDAGTGLTVTGSGFSATHGGVPVLGYAVPVPSVSITTGVITQAVLTADIVGDPTKTYDASTAALLDSTNYALTGVAAGESITVNGASSVAYDSADAGSRTVNATLTVPNFTVGTGVNLNNYILPTAASGAGLINPAPLTVTNVTANSKVYDGTTTAVLNTGGAGLFGVIAGEQVTLDSTAAAGAFATKNVGSDIAVTASGFTVGGAGAANYVVTQPMGLVADITPASLTFSNVIVEDKVYDGTATATLDVSQVVRSGVIPGDDVTLSRAGATINFTSSNVGSNIPVVATGLTLTGADAGNYVFTSPSGLAGDITPAPLTLSITGNPTRVYNGTTVAAVGSSNYTLSGFAPGEGASIFQVAAATYDSPNAGARTVSASVAPSDFVADAGTLLSNYTLPTTVSGPGTITQAQIAMIIVGDPTKAYDGNANATLTTSNYFTSGFIAGEGVEVTQTQGLYSSSDAGTRTVTATIGTGDLVPTGAALLSNYIFPTMVSGVGTITQVTVGGNIIDASIVGNPTKIYDGTTVATLTTSNFNLTGFVNGDGATVTQTVGEYGSANAGVWAILAQLAPADFTANQGTNLSNYTLPTEATGVGTIERAQITAAIVLNPTKVYDGTTSVQLGGVNYAFTGFVAGEGVTVGSGFSVDYDSANAGARTVTAQLPGTALVANSGTLLQNYILPSTASGPGTITPAPLTITNIAANDKVYDTTTTATLNLSDVGLFGVVASDNITLDTADAAASFATKNVGSNIAVTATGFTLVGAGQSNYQLFQPTGLTASITPKGLAILNVTALDKSYDATTVATLSDSAAALGGVLGTDAVGLDETSASANFHQSNIGTNLPVSATGFVLTGADASNYSLSQPSGLTASINPAVITAIIVGDPTKIYDGGVNASLTASDYTLTGFVAGQGASVPQSAGAQYDSANAGARTVTSSLVVSDFVANSGTDLSNYLLPTTGAGPGTITKATLAAAILGDPTKVYDQTNAATLTSANFQINGFVAGESATVTQTAGTYDSADAGARTVNATLAAGDYTPGAGTLLSNYNLPATALGAGTITPASLSIINVIAQDKVYDGTTLATLDSTAASLTGVFGGDAVSLTSTSAVGTFADKNVAAHIAVTASGYGIGGASAANYTVTQPTGLFADITEAILTLASVTKVYDAGVSAPSASSAYGLSGVVGGDSVSVDTSGVSGSYASKNVGSSIGVTLTGVALAGPQATDYSIAATTTNSPIGIITPAPLAVIGVVADDKVYDRTVAATLDNSGAGLSGVLGTDMVTLSTVGSSAVFADFNAGVNKPVTASGYSVGGGDAGNYMLSAPAGLTAAITPLAITLTSVERVYTGDTTLPTNGSAYGFTGVIAGDTVTANTTALAGAYADKNVAGSLGGGVVVGGIDVTLSGLSLAGASAGNYSVGSGVTAQAIGIIDPKQLAVSIVGTPTKVYDRTTDATLTSANYDLTGFVTGEGGGVTKTTGTYNSQDVDAASVSTTLVGGDFSANSGTVFSNYILPASATGAGTITPKTLTVSGVLATDKVYDGTTADPLSTGGAMLNGVVAGDTTALDSSGATGTFASPSANTNVAVTASGFALTNNGLGDYALTQPTGLFADINQALLTLTQVTRVYTAGTELPTVSGAYTLSGEVAGDDVSVDTTGVGGDFATKNVGSGITVHITGLALQGSAAGDYSIVANPADAAIGQITPASVSLAGVLANTKVYDGTTALTLNNAGTVVVGRLGSDDLGVNVAASAASFPTANVGTYLVSPTGYALTGADAGNYVLTQPTGVSPTISPATLTAIILGTQVKTYDGTTAATLASSNYALTGFVSGQGASITQTAGTFASPNAGARIVSATLASTDFTADSGTLLTNYTLPTSASGAGQIDQAALTAAIVGTPAKTYDGTTAASLTTTNYALSGFVSGEGAAVGQTAGTFASPNAGARIVSAALAGADFTADSGTLLANYTLPSSANGVGQINQAALTAAIVGTPAKTYDGTTAASLTTTNYALSGFISGEGATVGQTAGTFASPNAGARIVSATLASTDFTADSGTLLTNYTLPTSASGAGQIDQAALTAIIVGTPTKTYDGGTAIALTQTDYALLGFISGQGASITQTAGTFASPNAGARIVSAALAGADFTADSGTLLANYTLPSSANGVGQINQAALTAAIVGTPAKTYDGTTVASLTTTNYALSGFVSGEGATVGQTAGTYSDPDAGPRTVTASLGAGDFTATGSTLLTNYTLPTSANGAGQINQAALTALLTGVSKTYDGTTVATLASTNYALTGFVSGQGASITQTAATFASPNAGARIVSATLASTDFTADSGTLLANYVLPTSASGAGLINQAALTAAIVGTPAKTYDGTTVASLTTTNYALSGFVSGEGATVGQTAGTYSDPDAGPRTVTASLGAGDFTATGSTLLTNYTLPTSASGAGQIDEAALTALLTGVSKTYDGTTVATLASTNYALTGFVSGQGASITQTAGTFASPNAGARIVSATLASTDFTADSGTLLTNYTLPTSASGAGQIDQAALTAIIVGTPTKTYDGGTAIALTQTDYALLGFISGQGASITQTAGTFASPNAGARIVSAALAGADFTADSGTLLANYTLPSSANGVGQINQAALTAAIVGTPAKTYDGTTVASLTTTNYALSGFVSGEGATVGQTAGTYSDPDAGPRTVTASLGAGDFTATGSTLLTNYTLPTSANGAGQINQAALTALLTGVSKTYDGTTVATLASTNYALTGFVSGQGASITQTAATFASPNAGARIVSATLASTDFTADSGTLLANYVLPTSASGAGLINQAALTAAIVGTPAKTYDGTTVASLTTTNYALSGFVSGEGATVGQTAGTYSDPDAGPRTVTASLGAGDFTATGSTLLTNYTLPTSASGAGQIDEAALTALLTGVSKTYDGTTVATLASTNYALTGFVSGQGASITQTAATFASPNAGARIVSATLASTDFTADSGTLLTNYTLPTSASGAGQIDQAALTAIIVGTPTKTYDGGTAIALTQTDYALLGFISGQGASITQTAGTFASPNAGARTLSAALAGADFTADSGTLLSNYTLPSSANGVGQINQAALTAAIVGTPTKTYDGGTAIALTQTDYALLGFVSGEGATVGQTAGTYSDPDAGARIVTATLAAGGFTADSGTLLTNYTLPTSANGAGQINQAALTALLTGVSKTYDGTTVATLASTNYALTGFVSGQGASITQTAATFASPNAGARTVTATLAAGDFTATGSTLLTNYTLPTSASGAGLINQAALTAIIVGTPAKTYDGTTVATLASTNYALSGFVSGEGATVGQTAGTYSDPNAGARAVTASLGAGDFTATGSTLLTNYILPTSASGAGLINQAALTAAIVGTPAKTYDGTTVASLTTTNYALSGFVSGEGATVGQTAGTYSDPDAGARTVSATLAAGDFTATGSTLLTNYVLPTSASGAGLINQAALTAIIVGTPAKTYDGTTAASLTTTNYALIGFVSGEGATVGQTAGTYSDPNAGARTVSATLGAGDFTADSGTLLANYTLPTSANGVGQINQAALTATIVGTPTKTYDGTTAASLTTTDYALTGFVSGQGASITQTAAAFASPNAGARIVTATLAGTDFTADSGTLLSNYTLPASASGAGLINQAALTAIIVGTPAKTYDGTTAASLASSNYALSGFVSGEGAAVGQTVGAFSLPDAGARTLSAALASADFTATGSTLLTNYVLPASASGAGLINQAALTAAIVGTPAKTYDGTTVASLTNANYALSGFVSGEGATVGQTAGTYSDPDAGARTVTATLAAGDFTADSGTLLANYTLPSSANGVGQIDQAALTAAIVGTPAKTYDGTTVASLTTTNYALSGFVSGEGASITQTQGQYDAPDVGARKVTADLGVGDFAAASGTILANYVLPATASGAGEITAAPPPPTTPVVPSLPCTFTFSGECGGAPSSPQTALKFLAAPARVYIPYPSPTTLYLGDTRGFGALPSIFARTGALYIGDDLTFDTGPAVINSTEEVLLQGDMGKSWRIIFIPRPTVVGFMQVEQ